MLNEENKTTAAQELPDEEMDKVAGGANKRSELIRRDVQWNGILHVYAVY